MILIGILRITLNGFDHPNFKEKYPCPYLVVRCWFNTYLGKYILLSSFESNWWSKASCTLHDLAWPNSTHMLWPTFLYSAQISEGMHNGQCTLHNWLACFTVVALLHVRALFHLSAQMQAYDWSSCFNLNTFADATCEIPTCLYQHLKMCLNWS